MLDMPQTRKGEGEMSKEEIIHWTWVGLFGIVLLGACIRAIYG